MLTKLCTEGQFLAQDVVKQHTLNMHHSDNVLTDALVWLHVSCPVILSIGTTGRISEIEIVNASARVYI